MASAWILCNRLSSDDVGDRKWNNGEVINTLHKFTDEEKAYDLHYDLQLKR